MKTTTFILPVLLMSFLQLFTQVQWESVQTPFDDNYTSVWITDNGWIYCVSSEGNLIRTNDNGNSWITTGFDGYRLNSICFSDNLHGAIAANSNSDSDAVALITSDGGETWQDNTLPTMVAANCIYFTDSLNGVVGGNNDAYNQCLYTTDGGQYWTQASLPAVSESDFYDVHFRDNLFGNMTGKDGALYSTANGGMNWLKDISFPLINNNAIYNFGESFGVIAADEGKAYFTLNKWGNHIETTTNVTVNLNGVWGAAGTNKLWAVGDEGTIIYTENYLVGWTLQNSGTTENLNDVFILNETMGAAVGDNGAFLLMSLPGSVPEKQHPAEIDVYPNPCRDKVFVSFYSPVKSNIEMNVYDLLGNKILSLTAGKKQPGNHEIAFDVSGLNSGIYFVRLNSEEFSIVEKFVIE